MLAGSWQLVTVSIVIAPCAGLPKAPVFQSGLLSKMSTSHTLTWTTESHETITEYRLTYRKIMVRVKCHKCQVSSVKCQKC